MPADQLTPAEREKLFQRITHLSNRTIDRGCTEAEAVAAAEMLGRLLTQYGLSMSDVEIKDSRCETLTFDSGKKMRDNSAFCLHAVAKYTNTKTWIVTGGRDTYKAKFFGLPADVQVASYLYQVIRTAMIAEKDRFNLAGQRSGNPHGRTAAHTFELGFINRVSQRLEEMAQAKAYEGRSTGRDLVVLTNQVVEQQYAELGLKFSGEATTTSRGGRNAYEAGKAAGDRLGLNPAVTGGHGGKLLGR